mmetsp:Transcript_32642/g.54958  ORF Transcript_32642/g.54958 Transcript_32642/m.54958 type:complete len:95 (+) Transcript_32642:1174-1458(+)
MEASSFDGKSKRSSRSEEPPTRKSTVMLRVQQLYPGKSLEHASAAIGSASDAWNPPNMTPPGFLETVFNGSLIRTRLHCLEISKTLTRIMKKGG